MKINLSKDEEGFYYNPTFLKKKHKKFLLINPSVIDTDELFYADEISLPSGILRIANYLISQGHKIYYFDFEPYRMIENAERKRKNPILRFGEEFYEPEKVSERRYIKRKINKTYKGIQLYIYGKSFKEFYEVIAKLSGIDEVLITTVMTYHYPHLKNMIKIIRIAHSKARIIVGGLLATLCPEKLEKLDAEIQVGNYFDADYYRPLIELSHHHVAPIRFVKGCPNNCSYCAVSKIEGKTPKKLLRFHPIIQFLEFYELGFRQFTFYDSNILCAKNEIMDFLDFIINKGYSETVAFNLFYGFDHNRIDDDFITKISKVKSFRGFSLPLESAEYEEFHTRFHKGKDHLQRILGILEKLRKKKIDELYFYVIAGFPEQSLDSILKSILFGMNLNLVPIIFVFTPIPKTEEYDKYKHLFKDKNLWELNPNLYPCESEELRFQDLRDIRNIFNRAYLSKKDAMIINDVLGVERHIPLDADSKILIRFKELLKQGPYENLQKALKGHMC